MINIQGSKKNKLDFYATPINVIHNFFKYYKLKEGDILEPCAGNGSFIKVIRDLGYINPITSIELREEEYNNLKQYSNNEIIITNFLDWKPNKPYKTIITNPPFSLAQEFLEKCFKIANDDTEIIMLLRLAFLESRKRYSFWQQHPINKLYVLSERPSFTGKGTDATAYAFFVWNNNNKQEIKVI